MTPPGRKENWKFISSGRGIGMPRSCFFARITRPYADLSGVVARWALRCERLVVYEHTGSETEKVHIHAAIFAAHCDKKTLKNDYSFLGLKGNEDHSWKEWDGVAAAITYMTKGELEPKYLKGYTSEEINELKAKWVAPKVYEKESKDVKVWNEFLHYEYERNATLTTVLRTEALNYWDLRAYARGFCIAKCGVWSGQAAAYFKMIVYTYAMKYDVRIPRVESVETPGGTKYIPTKIDPLM